jgi:hypothetical protein
MADKSRHHYASNIPRECSALLDYTRANVKLEDISKNSFPDPGFEAYVAVASEIWNSGLVPKASFDFTENLCLNYIWYDKKVPTESFRRFQNFMNAAALLMAAYLDDNDRLEPNCQIAILITNALDSNDQQMRPLLDRALDELIAILSNPEAQPSKANEIPALWLAKLALACIAERSNAELDALAERLMALEIHNDWDPRFLWGSLRTHYGEKLWKPLIPRCILPQTPTLALVLDAVRLK